MDEAASGQSKASEPNPHSDGIAWSWEALETPSTFYASMAAALLRQTPPGTRVLEIGVGTGYLLSRLTLEANCVCIGIDLLSSATAAAKETARRLGATLGLVQGSGFALPFPDDSFDVVLSLGVIEHFTPQRSRELLLEHARVCRPRGRVIVSVPNGLDLWHTVLRRWRGRSYPWYPERSYMPWGLSGALREIGLLPIAADGYAPLWSLRQHWLGYPVIAALHRTGLLERLNKLAKPRLLSLIGNLTLQVATKNEPRTLGTALVAQPRAR